MAKVNLLTIHWGNSYGGTMQTYATVKLLESLGHEVSVINLVNPKTSLRKSFTNRSSLWDLFRRFQFDCFKKRYISHFTEKMYAIDHSLIPECDYTIVGSDQVWNKDITYPINKYYFLDFAQNSNRISFASSFGKSVWEESEEYTQVVKNELKKFKALSVREKSAVDICQDVFGVNAIQVLDPTLIWNDYDILVKSKKKIHEIYPFLLKPTAQTHAICKIISKELNLPIYKTSRIKVLFGRSPQEWLRRMKNSDFIVTDSFHGLAFSIIFKKQFIVLCADEKKFTRLKSLMDIFNIEDRFVSSADNLLINDLLHKKIDYSSVDEKRKTESRRCISYLKETIT